VLSAFVGEMERAIADGDASSRGVALRRLSDLFVQEAPALSEQHVRVFDEVLFRLAQHLEFSARLALSEQLADIPNAPRSTVKDLAFDLNIAVARPVLERSPRLSETELVELALSRGQEQLLAISCRSSLTEKVTDVLVERGDRKVVRSVASNGTARFSQFGFSTLVEKARADEHLRNLLSARKDLPEAAVRTVLQLAREHVVAKLEDEMGPDGLIEAAVERAASVPTSGAESALLRDLKAAASKLGSEAADGSLDEDRITAWIREGRIAEALAAVAQLGNLPLAMVAGAYEAPGHDALLFVVRSLGFGWIVFKLLLAHRAGRQPAYDVMRSAFDSYQQTSRATAQRIVRFTASREFAGEAAA